MLPANSASSVSVAGVFLPPDSSVTSPAVDYEIGGIAIGDTSHGLQYQTWRAWVQGINVMLQSESGSPIVLFSSSGIVEMSFCFDQNMRPAVAYLQSNTLRLRWFDSTINNYRIDSFGPGRNPRMSLDDKRSRQALNSDIIFAYIRDANLCYRQQRDRFGVERILKNDIKSTDTLKNIGMGNQWRLQFEII